MLKNEQDQRRCVLLAQSGDRDALNALLTSLQGPLYRFLRDLVGNDHLAEDVLQDVLVQVCRSLFWLREPEALWPWVYRISARAGLKRLRQERRWLWKRLDELGLDEPSTLTDPPFGVDFDSEKLSELVAAASPASRVVLLLHYGQGLSLDEVAAALQLSVGTVKSRLSYGLARLRQQSEPQSGIRS